MAKPNYKNDIESLGFELSKRGNRYGAFTQMNGGIYFSELSYKKLFEEIENYFKSSLHPDETDIERNEFGDEFVGSCSSCGQDFNSLNDNGMCKSCK